MDLREVIELVEGELLVGSDNIDVKSGFSSDLMSDVLAFIGEEVILITGLVNNQVIRTAEMLDINAIVFVRGKRPTKGTIKMAELKEITLVSSEFTLFKASGILFANGLSS